MYIYCMDELKLYIEKIGVPEFASRMGVSRVLVYKVLRGERGVSKAFAEKAEKVSGGFLKKEHLIWSQPA